MHHSTVVGGDEVGVVEPQAVGFGYGVEAEALRRLHVAQHGARCDVADVSLCVDLHNGVGARYGHVDGLVMLEGCEAVGDDALRDEGTDGIVDQEID